MAVSQKDLAIYLRHIEAVPAENRLTIPSGAAETTTGTLATNLFKPSETILVTQEGTNGSSWTMLVGPKQNANDKTRPTYITAVVNQAGVVTHIEFALPERFSLHRDGREISHTYQPPERPSGDRRGLEKMPEVA